MEPRQGAAANGRQAVEAPGVDAALEALLEDPMARLLMRRDGVDREQLLLTMRAVRDRLVRARRR